MDKFWRWVVNEAGEEPVRTLHLEGYIAESSWFDDDITPKQFKEDLYAAGSGAEDIVVKLHSPGGDVFAAAQIYNMLKEYPGHVTIQIDGLAASAASVVAMAGDEVCVSPVSVLMIHNPAMLVAGEEADLEVGIQLLQEVKESIINAYALKTGLSHAKISHMMDRETWMSAHKAMELKFADRMLYDEPAAEDVVNGFMFDTLTVTNTLAQKLPGMRAKLQQMAMDTPTSDAHEERDDEDAAVDRGTNIPIHQLERRLELIKNWR